MAAITWLTPAGFLGTVTERVTTSTYVQAVGDNVSYSIISGELPGGLRFSSTGTISGTPYSVGELVTSQFVVRAANDYGVIDRTFSLNTDGPDAPVWLTPSGFISAGFNNQKYIINDQNIDYQLSAAYDKLPAGQQLRFFIKDRDGSLPPGLELREDGRIIGQVTDTLKLLYKAANKGGYDLESYDYYPYDHVSITGSELGISAKFIAKTYQFFVTVTDGVSSSRRLFKIKVEDGAGLRVDNTDISIDSEQYLTDAGYLLSPQWLTPANLGIVRADNKQIIQLNSYDFAPFYGATVYDWTTPTTNQDGTPSIHPPNFVLDSKSGALYASMPYLPAYSISYKFTIWAVKTDASNGEQSLTTRTFTLVVRGEVESTIEFVSPENVGSLYPGQQSELSVVARHIGATYSIHYNLTGGTLPDGLTLADDGSIAGKIDYNSQLYFDRAAYGYGQFMLDGGTTTIDKRYRFTVQASDVYRTSAVEQEFFITVSENSLTKFTKIYAQPLLPLDQRDAYAEFINDPYTFNKSLMYRLNDAEFGIQENIRLYFEHGLEQIDLENYADELRKYFYRKNVYFGSVKYTKAEDSNKNHVYDIVYVEVIDPLQNSKNQSLLGPQQVGDVTVYTNSIANMRSRLESIQIQGRTIETDEYLLPRYMRTIQKETGSPLGFILAVPLCYALPGNGDTIVKRIAVSGFDFSTISFEIDRLTVENNLTTDGAKYLLFPRITSTGTNLGESLSYITGPDVLSIDTEDGNPLTVEF